MKILVITDIHKDYTAAQSAYLVESPDIVLDCGDHDQVINLFQDCPHFYIRGNHEPEVISYTKEHEPLPLYIPNGSVIQFSMGPDSITFSGIDGNYGTRQGALQISEHSLHYLKALKPKTVALLLLHESPLNVAKDSRAYPMAMQMLNEIERLQPKLVFSGHSNRFSEQKSAKSQTTYINLLDMSSGYLIITVQGDILHYEKKVACFGTHY